MNVGRSLGSEHLFGVHAVGGGGGDAHADCPAVKSTLQLVSKETSLRGRLFFLPKPSGQSQRQEKRWTCSKGIGRREAALRAA